MRDLLAWLTFCRAACVAVAVTSLTACAGLAKSDYEVGMLDQKIGLEYGARNSFVKAANGGNADAQNMLGWYWANGLGHLPKDTIQACNWYAVAANQGHPEAINNLGTCYEYPGFVQQDTKRAIALYTLAARKGNPKAQQNLVRLGQPVPTTDLVPKRQQSAPMKEAGQPAVRSAAPTPVPVAVVRQPAPPAQPGRSVDWVALATLALDIFVAAKGYGAVPQPVFAPPRSVSPPSAPTVNVQCTTTALGTTAFTNCH